MYTPPLLKYLTLKALRYGSHSVTCKLHHYTCLYLVSIHQMAHPRLRLRTSNCSLLLIYLPWKDERLSWRGWLVTQWDSLPARRQSPIPVLTGLDVEQLRWSRPTHYRCTKLPTHSLVYDSAKFYHCAYATITSGLVKQKKKEKY